VTARRAGHRGGGTERWQLARSVKESGVDADFYIFRDRSKDTVLPWDIIDGGMKAFVLQVGVRQGLREERTLPVKRQKDNAKFLARVVVRSGHKALTHPDPVGQPFRG